MITCCPPCHILSNESRTWTTSQGCNSGTSCPCKGQGSGKPYFPGENSEHSESQQTGRTKAAFCSVRRGQWSVVNYQCPLLLQRNGRKKGRKNFHPLARPSTEVHFDPPEGGTSQIFTSVCGTTRGGGTPVHVDALRDNAEPPCLPPAEKKPRKSRDANSLRAARMSQNPAIRKNLDASFDWNPQVPGIFNRYNNGKNNHVFNKCAKKIQHE